MKGYEAFDAVELCGQHPQSWHQAFASFLTPQFRKVYLSCPPLQNDSSDRHLKISTWHKIGNFDH